MLSSLCLQDIKVRKLWITKLWKSQTAKSRLWGQWLILKNIHKGKCRKKGRRMQWERGHKNKGMVKESPLMVAKVAHTWKLLNSGNLLLFMPLPQSIFLTARTWFKLKIQHLFMLGIYYQNSIIISLLLSPEIVGLQMKSTFRNNNWLENVMSGQRTMT